MALSDCLKKVSLSPEEAAAIEASAEAKQAQGMTQAAAERAAAEEFLQGVMAEAEDIRAQLNAPAPVEIERAERPSFEQATAPEIKIVGAAELGETFDSRRELFQTAYHGTGNSTPYEKLSYEKVGAKGGEGSQLEGWGLYVTGSKAAGKFYREQNTALMAEGQKPLFDALKQHFTPGAIVDNGFGGKDVVIGFDGASKWNWSATVVPASKYQEYQKSKSEKLTRKVEQVPPAVEAAIAAARPEGRLYTVEIPDDEPGTYLDLNTPINRQPPEIVARLVKAFASVNTDGSGDEALAAIKAGEITGEGAYKRIVGQIRKGDAATGQQSQKAASDALHAAGILGNKYRGDEGQGDYFNYVLFQDIGIREYQQGERGSVVFVDDQYIINLFPGADLSTLLHETGHIFLEELRSIKATGQASAQTEEDHKRLMDWLGNKGEAITRAQHEQFASSFELYLMEGKAPSAALKDAFGSFRRWLTRIYQRVVANDARAGLEKAAGFKVELTDEIRGVFDRLLALEPESRAATVDAEFDAIAAAMAEVPEPRKEEGAAPRVNLDELVQDARRKLEDRLFAKRAAEVAKRKPEWRREAEKEVKGSKLYQAITELRANPLDRAEVVAQFGEAAAKALSTKHGDLTTDGEFGQSPDVVASSLGYDSGKALIDALRAVPTLEGAIRMGVQAKADEAWESYTAADAMAETPEFAKVLDASRAYLAEALGRPGKVDKKALRKKAEQEIAAMQISQATRADIFLQNMARLQRQERAAAAKGDLTLAYQKNTLARYQFELAAVAREAKAKVEEIVARAEKLRKVDYRAVQYQFAVNAQATAARYGLIKFESPEDRKSLRALLAGRADSTSDEFEPAMDVAAAFPDWVLDEQNPGRFQDKTLDDLVDIDHTLRFLMTRGRQLRDDTVLAGQVKVEDAVADMLERLSTLKDKKVFEEGGFAANAASFADAYLAGLNIWQFRTRAMDGYTTGQGPSGPAERYLFDPLHEKSGDRFKRFDKLQKQLAKPMAHLREQMLKREKYIDTGISVTEAMKAKGRPGWTFENLVTVALNMGNDYNSEAMAAGLGFKLDDGTPDTSMLHRLTETLSRKDWEAVQDIWDAVNSLWPDLSAVFERRNGFPLAKVGASSFLVHLPGGETLKMAGGYYPVKFDSTLSDRQAEQDEATDLKNAAGSLFPLVGTKSGMTKQRSSTGGKPLQLTFGGLASHLKDTVQYISYSETVVDVYRIAKHPAFKAAFEQKFGSDAYKAIRKLLADIGLPEPGGLDKMDSAINWLKGASTAWALGLNVKTALTQPVAVFNYAADEGWAAAALGAKAVVTMGPTAAREAMFELSPFMKERWVAADREVADAVKGISWMAKPRLKKVQDAMFSLIQVSDHTTVLPLWWGAYQKRVAAGMAPAEAAVAADKAISATVPGAPRALDSGAFHRDKRGWMRLLTSFSTATFHFGNRQRFYFNAYRAGQISTTGYLSRVATEGIAAPLVLQAFFDVLWGNFPPDDKEDWKRYALSLGTYQFVGLPIVREMLNTALTPSRGFGDNIPAFRGLDMMAKSGNAVARLAAGLGDEQRQGRALMAFADLISFYYKVPASRVFARTSEGVRQLDQLDDDAALEWLNKAFTVLAPDPDKRNER